MLLLFLALGALAAYALLLWASRDVGGSGQGHDQFPASGRDAIDTTREDGGGE